MSRKKNTHAVKLGREGGKATARRLTKDERIASARHAAMKRWEAVRIARQETCQVSGNGRNKVK